MPSPLKSRLVALALLVFASSCGPARSGCSDPSESHSHALPIVDAGSLPATQAASARPFERIWTGAGAGKHRLVILVHGAGGPELFTDHDRYRIYPEALARHGYDVVMPHYSDSSRSNEDAVRVIREAVHHGRAERGLSSASVGVIGFSRGGFITVLAGMRGVEAGAIVEFYGGATGMAEDFPKTFPPTLILHGQADDTVEVRHALALAEIFRTRGIPYDSKLYPGEGHGFRGAALTDSIERMTAFLDAHLKEP